MMDHTAKKAALDYHEADPPGKISIRPTKPVINQADLGLAYSPGVAHACTAIAEDPAMVSRLTARGNLVAVITNGTAVLGLGNIGPLASKPVMEGKAVLFKKFAGIDCFDIEVAENHVAPFVEAVARLGDFLALGGLAAMGYALRHPSGLQALVIVDIAPRVLRQDYRAELQALGGHDPRNLGKDPGDQIVEGHDRVLAGPERTIEVLLHQHILAVSQPHDRRQMHGNATGRRAQRIPERELLQLRLDP